MKQKFKEKNGELFLYTDFFDLKLNRLRQVMVRNRDEPLFNVVEGLQSPSGMVIKEKEAFLLHIAYGLHQKILMENRVESKSDDETLEENSENSQDNID